jgi:hypothetical protein
LAQEVPGQSGHAHQFTPQELYYFNCSHKFNKLSFGEDFPGAVHPLDNVEKTVTKGKGYIHYKSDAVRSWEVSILYTDRAHDIPICIWKINHHKSVLLH